jgi:Lysosomal transcription factor, NCU-G1
MYTENTTQVDVVFDQVPSKHSYNNARLAMEIVTMVTEPSANFSMEISRSLDDEYTPGVFKVS